VNWLVDAHLPRRIVYLLRQHEHDAIHTLDLPNGNRTTDAELLAIAAREGRIVVTKDADFVNSFIFLHQPRQLLLIATGNIRNQALEWLILQNLPSLVTAFAQFDFVELSSDLLIIHE
jgi:predicted nuclease of predicted toxin-antitoxin system